MTREQKIVKIAKFWLSRMDLKSLEKFYYDITVMDFEDVEDNEIEIFYLDAIDNE
jgi:hypothetical protein